MAAKKNTLPMAEVMIPIGISWSGKATRAITSTQTIKQPPKTIQELMKLGVMATVNQAIDQDTATLSP